MYRVLWFDDKFKSYDSLMEEALLRDIELVGYTNAEEGVEELTRNYESYDAVLLDGLFYENPDQKGTDINDDAFGEVAKTLHGLQERGVYMPWFIFSGQQQFRKGDSKYIKLFKKDSFSKGRIYDKIKDDDFEELCDEIKKAVDSKKENQIKLDYPEVFKIFRNYYLDKTTENTLIQFILLSESKDQLERPRNEFTKLRKIIEKLVDKAEELKLIPSEIGTANLTRAVGFLCNCDNDYKLLQNYFHPTINFFLPVLVNILQDGSHSKKGMRYKADDFAISRDNGYFFQSCLYQILDVLIAFNNLFQKKEHGRLAGPFWKKILEENIFEGPLEQDAQGNYYCGKYLLPYKKVHKIYSPGQKFRVLAEDENTNESTRVFYAKFAVKFEAID